jgi:hypothetical protein
MKKKLEFKVEILPFILGYLGGHKITSMILCYTLLYFMFSFLQILQNRNKS